MLGEERRRGFQFPRGFFKSGRETEKFQRAKALKIHFLQYAAVARLGL